MYIPSYTSLDFLEAFLKLLPQGRAWDTYSDSNMALACNALMGSYARSGLAGLPVSAVGSTASAAGSANRAGQLLLDTMPAWNELGAGACIELLDAWNATLGLPDPCLAADASLEQQVRSAVAKFTASGGQTIAYFVAIAATLGYSITVTEYAPFRTDVSTVDQPLYDVAMAHAWQITTGDTGSWLFEPDRNVAGEPLGGDSNTVLECVMAELKPAHTQIVFNFI